MEKIKYPYLPFSFSLMQWLLPYVQSFTSPYTAPTAWPFMQQSQTQYGNYSHVTSNPMYFGISKSEVLGGQSLQFGIGPTYDLSNTPIGPSG